MEISFQLRVSFTFLVVVMKWLVNYAAQLCLLWLFLRDITSSIVLLVLFWSERRELREFGESLTSFKWRAIICLIWYLKRQFKTSNVGTEMRKNMTFWREKWEISSLWQINTIDSIDFVIFQLKSTQMACALQFYLIHHHDIIHPTSAIGGKSSLKVSFR